MNSPSIKRNFLLCFAVLIIAVASASGQNVGSVQGTITDPTGAGVLGATVTLTDLANGVSRTGTSSESGEFSFVQVNPGKYKVEISKDGFKAHVEQNVTVLVATPTRL